MLRKLPLKPSQIQLNLTGFFAFGFLVVILLLMIAIVSVQHQVRHLETEYAQKLLEEKQLSEEKGRLSLEKYYLSAAARVEQIARQELGMTIEKNRITQKRETILLEMPINPSEITENQNGRVE